MNGKHARRRFVEHAIDLLPLAAAVVGLILFLAFWGG